MIYRAHVGGSGTQAASIDRENNLLHEQDDVMVVASGML